MSLHSIVRVEPTIGLALRSAAEVMFSAISALFLLDDIYFNEYKANNRVFNFDFKTAMHSGSSDDRMVFATAFSVLESFSWMKSNATLMKSESLLSQQICKGFF